MNALGRLIERARVARGLSQDELADQLGVAQPTVSSWIAGKSRPKPKRFPLMSAVLGVSIEDLRQAYFADDEPLEKHVRKHESEITSILARMERLEAVMRRRQGRRPERA